MSLLRIYCSFADSPQRCRWVLLDGKHEPLVGEGRLSEAPRRVDRTQLLFPAAQVRITRVDLPHGVGRDAGSMLAFAVEEATLGEPDGQHVTRIASSGEKDVAGGRDILAILDKQSLQPWLAALDAQGIRDYELYSETLLLPWARGHWSLAWDGREGFVRSGEFEGAATDCGDRTTPPLSLRLMLEAAAKTDATPASVAVYLTTAAADAAPDLAAWQAMLGVDLHPAGPWDWKTAPMAAGVPLQRERRPWRLPPGLLGRLRPAAWIVGLALAIHAVSLVIDWTRLASEQQRLRLRMVAQFRAAFPDAVAVVDPALQMRRKLAEARHSAGLADSGDFLPMLRIVAAAAKDLPGVSLRVVSYESGRMSLEITAEGAAVHRLVARLRQSGLTAEQNRETAARVRSGTSIITVRAS
ncbi:MAG TPA: type II secretion system protein GspL [Rhodocyclaceae bacterium]|nr:type II secretion system protein GspL [Rhodocyclaceae bacterium]